MAALSLSLSCFSTITHAIIDIDDRAQRKKRRGLINPLRDVSFGIENTDGPFTNLPKKIDVGEEFSLRFWSGENSFIEKEVYAILATAGEASSPPDNSSPKFQ
jgi:hypothetical protein